MTLCIYFADFAFVVACDNISECIPVYVVDQAGLQQQISSW